VLVSSLELRDFRSYAHENLALGPGLNVVVGPNGTGKTNLLEAVHVGVQGFPLRTRRDASTIRLGADSVRVTASGRRASGVSFRTAVVVDRAGGKRVTLDGKPVETLDELRRAFPTLAFTPDRLAVVKGGPLVRRTYLDRMTGRVMPSRATVAAEYGAAVAQRNAALRRVQLGVSSADAIAPWTEAVVQLGEAVDRCRAELVDRLGEHLGARADRLGLPSARVVYRPSSATPERLESLLPRDLERGTTGAGPHLAEIDVLSGDRDLRAIGSQGEQRLAVLALLLAEADVLLETRREPPLLLLDDVLSELDDERRSALLAGVPTACQTVLTTTSLRMLPPGGPSPSTVIEVSPGRAIAR
jgi:DNA replication and repair protein RecF